MMHANAAINDPAASDPFEGLDPQVREALGMWRSLNAEQRDYAMGFVSGWAPQVVISAAQRAIAITDVDEQLMRLGAVGDE